MPNVNVELPPLPPNDGFRYVPVAFNGTITWEEYFPPMPTCGPSVPFFEGEHWDMTNCGSPGQQLEAINGNKAAFAG